jgi:transposase
MIKGRPLGVVWVAVLSSQPKSKEERPVNSVKYVAMDVHPGTSLVVVRDAEGKVVAESVLATEAATILDFIHGLRGTIYLTFEEGTQSAWLYDLLVGRVDRLVVCNPRQNALLKAGNKSDRIDARKLSELLRAGLLSPVYHGENSTAAVKQLASSYSALTEDTTRVMSRLKAIYRSQAIPASGTKVYGKRHRQEWLVRIQGPGLIRRAQHLYQELDSLQALRREARRELIAECRQHADVKWLRSVPFLGPIRTAVLIARVQTPHRFRTKRQFWAYCGLALETRSSSDYQLLKGQLVRNPKGVRIRGLNLNHNHDLKDVFKSAATSASTHSGPWRSFYEGLLAKGMQPAMARLTLARKISAVTLRIWKKGERFDAEQLKPQTA